MTQQERQGLVALKDKIQLHLDTAGNSKADGMVMALNLREAEGAVQALGDFLRMHDYNALVTLMEKIDTAFSAFAPRAPYANSILLEAYFTPDTVREIGSLIFLWKKGEVHLGHPGDTGASATR